MAPGSITRCLLPICAAVLMAASTSLAGDYERGVEAYESKEFDVAIDCFTKTIEADPDSPSAYIFRGLAYREKKDYGKAIADFTDAIRINPQSAPGLYNRGLVHTRNGDLELALEDFDKAVRWEPRSAIPYNGRGVIHERGGDYELAVVNYLTAIRLDPKLLAGYNNLARLRASCPVAKFRNGKEALILAKKACELSEWNGAVELNSLAAAYAESGDFKEAVRWQKKAIELGADDQDFLDIAKYRLRLFEKGEPYRRE